MRWTSRDLRSLGIGLAYLAPSLVLFAAFVFIPLAETINLSLFNTRATGAITTFAGFDHYLELLTSSAFRTGLGASLKRNRTSCYSPRHVNGNGVHLPCLLSTPPVPGTSP